MSKCEVDVYSRKYFKKLSDGENKKTWDTSVVPGHEAFDFYQSRICAPFMPMRSELKVIDKSKFWAKMTTYQLNGAILNHTKSATNQIIKGRHEIAISPASCYYLKYQISGVSLISQRSSTIHLSPNEAGIFDSEEPFEIDRTGCDASEMLSFVLPKKLILNAAKSMLEGQAYKISSNPFYGRLVTDTALATFRAARASSTTGTFYLLDALASVVAAAITPHEELLTPQTRKQAQLLRVKNVILENYENPNFDIEDCAAMVGLSMGYIRNLLATEHETFGRYIQRERLRKASELLVDARHAHLPIQLIAYRSGYRDASYFGRCFREAYGATPTEWRKVYGTPKRRA